MAVQVMLADLAVVLEVIPVPVVHPLPQELNGRLGPIHLPRRHVEIIHKHNLIKKTWTHYLYHVQFEIRSVNMNVFLLFIFMIQLATTHHTKSCWLVLRPDIVQTHTHAYKQQVHKFVMWDQSIVYFVGLLTVLRPIGGPNSPFLRLSSLERMMFCVWLAVVWAEKLIMTGLYVSFGSWFRMKSCNEEVHNSVSHTRFISLTLNVLCRNLSIQGTLQSSSVS